MSCPHSSDEGVCQLCAVTRPDLQPVDPTASIEQTHIPSEPSNPGIDTVAPGSTVGRYVVHHRLAAGGMGVIYTAYDPQLDREVALKLLRGTRTQSGLDSGGQARLLREAQAMAQLSHPNVLPVYDVGTHANSVFVAMELVKGHTLDKWVTAKPRGWQEILDLFVQAGRGLVAAHDAGLIHRDFKPSNVLIGADDRPRVADFGIARSVRAVDRPVKPPTTDSGRVVSLSTPLTQAGALMGSPGYMAPEQYAGGATSAATDQFSYCVALYEAFYGERPFKGGTIAELAHAATIGRVPPAPKGSAVPPWIHRVIEQGLAPDPAQRHPSMAALLIALSRDPAQAARRRLAIGAIAVGAVASVLALVWVEHNRSRACQGAEKRLAGVWDPSIRARAEQAFTSSGRAYAALSWTRVSAAMDAYASAWVAARTEACEATRIRGEQTEAQLQLRLTCLDRRLDELGTLADAFESADTGVVDQSAGAVGQLSPVAACANVKSLEDRRQPPPEARDAVERVGHVLAQGRALAAAGKFALAREKLQPAVAEAAARDLVAQQAEAAEALGQLERDASRFDVSRDAYESSVRFAEAAGDDALAARSLASLVSVVGWHLERPQEGRMLASIARGIIERIGGDEQISAQLAEGLGDAEWQAGRRVESLEQYRLALAALIRLQGRESADVARLYSAIGWVLTEQGQLSEARDALERSRTIREKLLGPEHPSLVGSWNELGTLEESLGNTTQAVHCLERSVAIVRQSVGEDSVLLPRMELNLVHMLWKDGRAMEAQPWLRRAEGLMEQHPEAAPSYRVELLRTQSAIEGALGHLEEASRLGHAALTVSETASGKEHPSTAVVALELARFVAALKQPGEALELFDRYLKIEEKLGAADPEYASALADSAGPLLSLRRTDEAHQRLERAVALLPLAKENFVRGARARLALADARFGEPAQRARVRTLVTEVAAKVPPGKDADRLQAWLLAHPP